MSYEDRDKYGMYKNRKDAGPGPDLMGADTLIGDSVVNGADEDLGEIKEIMIDMHNGQVAYAVLAFGGFLGLGEKLFAVPLQALHLDTVNKRFVLNVDKERLKTAPGFNADAWPDMSDMQWANQIHSFYGTDPSRVGGPTMGPGVSMNGVIGATTGAGASTGAAMGSGLGAGSAGSAGMGAGTAGRSDLGTGMAGGGSMGSGSAGLSSGSSGSTSGSTSGAGSSGTADADTGMGSSTVSNRPGGTSGTSGTSGSDI
jgi:hypothetical protein